MDVRYALTHDLEKEFEDEARRAEKAVTRAIRSAGDGLKLEMRTQTRQAGLGNKMANTWRGDIFPRSGESLGAAATVYTKAPTLMRVFAEGATIKSKSGLFLAVPTDAAPKRGVGGKRISPATFPEHTLGQLRFVYRRRGPSLLVVDNVRIGAGGRARSNVTRRKDGTSFTRLKGRTTVAMFLMLPQVRIRKRPIDLQFSAEKWQGRVPTLIQVEFRKLDAQAGPA